MAQFDVYLNGSSKSKKTIPYVLDIQSELFGNTSTRVVVPFVYKKKLEETVDRLNPIFKVEDDWVIMLTSQMGAVPVTFLRKKITNLAHQRDSIIAAVDLLITGL